MNKLGIFTLFFKFSIIASLVISLLVPNLSVRNLYAQNTESTQTYGLNINYFDNPTGSTAWQNPNWIIGLVDSGAKWVRFESRYFNQTIFETDPSTLTPKEVL